MPRPLRAHYHPRKGRGNAIFARGYYTVPWCALATINVQAGVSDRPRSLDRMSLPSDGLAPSKTSPQFTGERIGSTEKDVGGALACKVWGKSKTGNRSREAPRLRPKRQQSGRVAGFRQSPVWPGSRG